MSNVTGLYARFGVRLPDLRDGWASCRCFTGRHTDRHPSARVHLQSGGFRCFTCDQAGGVLDALQHLGVYDRDDARRLAVEYGILEPDTPRPRRRVLSDVTRIQPPPQPESPADANGLVDYDHLPDKPAVAYDRTYIYANAKGEPVGRVRRLDLADGTKRIWQERPHEGGWAAGLNGAHLPLYRLPDVLDYAKHHLEVVVVEGEKAVEALNRIGIFATTNAGGSMKWLPEHTTALDGATVIPISDCDLPGREHTRYITSSLVAADTACRMPLDLAQWRHDGFDIVDYLTELADTLRAVDPNLAGRDLRDKLHDHLRRLLSRTLPATSRDLQLRQELDRHRDTEAAAHGHTPTVLALCDRCEIDRVHTIRAGVAYCPCGAHRAPP